MTTLEYNNLKERLQKYTEDWTMEEGAFAVSNLEELECAKSILSDLYEDVSHNLDKKNTTEDGTDYRINFKRKKNFMKEKHPKTVDPLGFMPDKGPTPDMPVNQGMGMGASAGGMGESLDEGTRSIVVLISKKDTIGKHYYDIYDYIASSGVNYQVRHDILSGIEITGSPLRITNYLKLFTKKGWLKKEFLDDYLDDSLDEAKKKKKKLPDYFTLKVSEVRGFKPNPDEDYDIDEANYNRVIRAIKKKYGVGVLDVMWSPDDDDHPKKIEVQDIEWDIDEPDDLDESLDEARIDKSDIKNVNANKFLKYLRYNGDFQNGAFADDGRPENENGHINLWSQGCDANFDFTDKGGVNVYIRDDEGTINKRFKDIESFCKWFHDSAFTFTDDMGANIKKAFGIKPNKKEVDWKKHLDKHYIGDDRNWSSLRRYDKLADLKFEVHNFNDMHVTKYKTKKEVVDFMGRVKGVDFNANSYYGVGCHGHWFDVETAKGSPVDKLLDKMKHEDTDESLNESKSFKHVDDVWKYLVGSKSEDELKKRIKEVEGDDYKDYSKWGSIYYDLFDDGSGATVIIDYQSDDEDYYEKEDIYFNESLEEKKKSETDKAYDFINEWAADDYASGHPVDSYEEFKKMMISAEADGYFKGVKPSNTLYSYYWDVFNNSRGYYESLKENVVIARHHRGLYADSMKTAKKFKSVDDMKHYFFKYWKDVYKDLKPSDITIDSKKTYDDRNGWNTSYVLCKGHAVGMCDTDFKEKDNESLVEYWEDNGYRQHVWIIANNDKELKKLINELGEPEGYGDWDEDEAYVLDYYFDSYDEARRFTELIPSGVEWDVEETDDEPFNESLNENVIRLKANQISDDEVGELLDFLDGEGYEWSVNGKTDKLEIYGFPAELELVQDEFPSIKFEVSKKKKESFDDLCESLDIHTKDDKAEDDDWPTFEWYERLKEKSIKKYRSFLNLPDDYIITESNINDEALNVTSANCVYDKDNLRSMLIQTGGKYESKKH